jgi:hypothetical protein
MSYQTHRRIALDPEQPLVIRMSHARSCALRVGRKWGVRRSVVLDAVRDRCGVNLKIPGTDEDLTKALAVLTELRENGLSPVGASSARRSRDICRR